jgi:hypothetical protein
VSLDLEKYNDETKAWAKKTRDKMVATGRSMGIEHRRNSPSSGDSLSKIKDRYKTMDGAVNEIRFSSINRSLIYTSIGAGKGIGGTRGSTWLDKYGKSHKTNPASLNKLGSKNRKAKNFINLTLDAQDGIEELADIATINLADAVVGFKPGDILQQATIKK